MRTSLEKLKVKVSEVLRALKGELETKYHSKMEQLMKDQEEEKEHIVRNSSRDVSDIMSMHAYHQ